MACCSCLSDKEAPVASILRCSNLTTGMDDAEIAELLASSQVRRHVFSAGEIVFHDGDQPHSLYILLRGEVHILKDTFSGRRIFISEVNEPGDMFGEVYEVLKRPYDIYVEAAKETELLEIGSRFFTIGGQSEHPSRSALLVERNLMRIFARKAYFMHGRIKVLASGSLREKIVRFLFQKYGRSGPRRARCEPRVPRGLPCRHEAVAFKRALGHAEGRPAQGSGQEPPDTRPQSL